MSGREGDVFSFNVDLWCQDLIGSFRVQIKNHTAKLGSQLELQLLALNRDKLAELEPDELTHAKSSLQKEIREITTSIGAALQEALGVQGEIMTRYLTNHIFMVPPDAILAVSPLEVPIPIAKTSESSSMEVTGPESQTKSPGSEKHQETQIANLKDVMLKIQKAEYFITRLKELYNENEEYIQVLQRILHSLVLVETAVRSNDTETSIQRMLDTLHSSWASLHSIQGELSKRGIQANINIKQTPVSIL